MQAPVIYVITLITVFSLIALAGIIDVAFVVTDHETISDWLRLNPRWFLIPLVITLTFLGFLSLHLFGK